MQKKTFLVLGLFLIAVIIQILLQHTKNQTFLCKEGN